MKPGQPSRVTTSKRCQLLRDRPRATAAPRTMRSRYAPPWCGRSRQMSCCVSCPRLADGGSRRQPLRTFRGVSAMRETCPASGPAPRVRSVRAMSVQSFAVSAPRGDFSPLPLDPETSPAREGVLHVDAAFPLHFGGRLDGARIAWRLSGNARGARGGRTRRHFSGSGRRGRRRKGLVERHRRSRSRAGHESLADSWHRFPRRQRSKHRTSPGSNQFPFNQRL